MQSLTNPCTTQTTHACPQLELLTIISQHEADGRYHEACTALAEALETTWSERLYVRFRRCVEKYGAALAQRQGGLSIKELDDGVASAPGTMDLDLRFLRGNALRALAHHQSTRKSEVTPGSSATTESERAELIWSVMRSRCQSTGYMPSAPPSQPIEHFYDLVKRSPSVIGGSQRARAAC